MIKILQARLQQYGNHELPYVQPGFRKDRGTRGQIVNTKIFDCVDHNKVWKILKEMGIPDLTCLLLFSHLIVRNLYTGQEAIVRTGHGATDWFNIGHGVWQDCILSPCLFNLYAEHIMRNPGLQEAQTGIKIARRKYQ